MTPFSLTIDNYDLSDFIEISEQFAQREPDKFGFVVTPNADHLVRLADNPEFAGLYEQAEYVLLDSRFIAKLQKLRGQQLPVCTGSDLTAQLLERADKDDQIVLIGGDDSQAEKLRQRFGLNQLQHHNPPMGFIKDPAAVADAVNFINAHSPFRYCFICVGSPQQEKLAIAVKNGGVARGLAFCVGASINFLTGGEKRAPKLFQKTGMEWLFRLLQDPKRMGRRYLINAPRVFRQWWNTRFILRSR